MAWPGVSATTALVGVWTARLGVVLAEHPGARRGWSPSWEDRRRRESDQRRNVVFFLAVPVAFALVWVVLLLVALLLRG